MPPHAQYNRKVETMQDSAVERTPKPSKTLAAPGAFHEVRVALRAADCRKDVTSNGRRLGREGGVGVWD